MVAASPPHTPAFAPAATIAPVDSHSERSVQMGRLFRQFIVYIAATMARDRK